MSKFKIGDKVVIIGNIQNFAQWTPLGFMGTVTHVDKTYVVINTHYYRFFKDVLLLSNSTKLEKIIYGLDTND